MKEPKSSQLLVVTYFTGSMQLLILTTLLVIFLNGHSCEETSTYSTKYDGINLDEILLNDRLLNNYVNCLLELGPCTPDGKELKQNLPDAIQNDCTKCTERQREGADQVMEYIIDHRPDDWKKLEEKYDSDGSYKRKYLERKENHKNMTNSGDNETNNSKEV